MLLDNKLITGTLCSLVFYTSLSAFNTPHLYILIHGTMASPTHMLAYGNKQHWCQPGHKSYALLQSIPNATIITCPWSGGMQLSDLLAGAKQLAILIQQHSRTHTIHIVAHSNGGNVALLALDTLIRTSYAPLIDELILLGTPIYMHWYPESIKAARRIYNLFSYGDFIQQVFGAYERVLPEQDHIFNIQVTINNAPATHNQLYRAEVVKHIPHFAQLFTTKNNYCLQCTIGKEPVVIRDTTRDADLLTDKTNMQQLYTSSKERWIDRVKEKTARYRTTAAGFAYNIWHGIED